MKITKFGHSCISVEEGGVRILLDPGNLSDGQNHVQNIDVVLITHEHGDHFHIESLKAVLKNNPQAKVITNKSVGALLEKEGIAYSVVEDGESSTENGVLIEALGKEHAIIHSSIPVIQNTGYFIANRLFHPGDAFTNPGKPVEVLALPVAAPWLKISEAIDYAAELKPKICFPIHDANLQSARSVHRSPSQILESKGIQFTVLEIDKTYEF